MARLPDVVSVLIEFTPGTWTDLTAYVNMGDSSVTTSRGRGNPYEAATTGSCSLVFDDPDGRFTPGSAVLTTGSAAPYYPYIRENKRVRVRVEHDSVTYDLFTGYIDSWETEFPDGYQGRTRVVVQASDRFKLLARRELRGTHEEVARAAGASAYYPLTMADPDSQALEVTDSIRTDGAGVLVPPKENVAARQRFEAEGDIPLYFDGCLTFSGSLGEMPGEGAGVISLVPLDLDTTGSFGFSVGGWFRAEDEAVTRVLYSDDNGAVITLASTGVLAGSLSAASVTSAASGFDDGEWHHVLLGGTVTAGSASVALYVDGIQVGSETDTYGSTGIEEPTATLNGIRTPGLSAKKAYYSGNVSYVAWALSSSDMGSSAADLYAAGRNGLDAEAAWYRAARVAAWAGISPTDYDLDTDTSALIGTQDVQGQSALEALQDIARAEGAPVFIAGDGRLTLHSRARRSTFTPAVTFDGTAGEVEVASVRMTLADEGLVNQVTGQVEGGPYVTVFISDVLVDVLTDELSAAELPPIGATVSAPWSSLDQAKYAAERYLVENYEARPRFGQIVITPYRASTGIWAKCLQLELGDLARVTGLPAAFAGATQRDFFVESVTWNLSMRDATLTIDATPLDRALGEVRFDDDLTGRFGHAAGVMTVGTVGALSGTGTGTFTVATSSGALWTLDSDDWPFFVKIDEEEMTISAVSGASSPQTFTVSARGVNGTTATAHSAGATVELWPVPVFAH